MYMLIRFAVGNMVEAVVLAKGRNRMRVAAAGFPETQWVTPTRQAVELEFAMPVPRRGAPLSWPMPTRAADSRCLAPTQ
jgi:hypothetical protein